MLCYKTYIPDNSYLKKIIFLLINIHKKRK